MKKIALTCVALSMALPMAAQAQQRMTPEQLIQYATEQRSCGDFRVASASYVNATENRIRVICSNQLLPVQDATGFVPGIGLGLGGAGAAAAAIGLGLAAAAAGGGGGSTPDTK